MAAKTKRRQRPEERPGAKKAAAAGRAAQKRAEHEHTANGRTEQGRAEQGRTEQARGQEGYAAQKRRYTAACAVLGAASAAGLAACLLLRNAWASALLLPLLGAVITALLWCALARLCLCRHPARLLARDFTRAVRRALEVPVWAGVTALLCGLPAEVPFSVGVLLVSLFLAAVPAAALLGVLSLCSAVRHLRAAPAFEPAIYREGPLVLAALLLAAELAALGWLMLYLFL